MGKDSLKSSLAELGRVWDLHSCPSGFWWFSFLVCFFFPLSSFLSVFSELDYKAGYENDLKEQYIEAS